MSSGLSQRWLLSIDEQLESVSVQASLDAEGRPSDDDDRTTKAEDERKAMEQLAPEWLGLFDEYEAQSTPEAVFVRSLDKLDMALQARVYMERTDLDLASFIDSARKTLGDHELLR